MAGIHPEVRHRCKIITTAPNDCRIINADGATCVEGRGECEGLILASLAAHIQPALLLLRGERKHEWAATKVSAD